MRGVKKPFPHSQNRLVLTNDREDQGAKQMDKEKMLRELYYNIKKSPVAFAGARDLFSECRRRCLKISFAEVVLWLEKQRTYSLHRRIKKNFPRDSVRSHAPFASTHIDLIDFSANPAGNHQRYVFILVDVFSGFIFAETIPHKTAEDAARAFAKIFNKIKELGYRINAVSSDQGSEFKGTFKNLLHNYAISQYFSTGGDFHLAFSELAVKHLKTRIAKYLTYHGASEDSRENEDVPANWLTPVKNIVDSLNARKKFGKYSANDVVHGKYSWRKVLAFKKERGRPQQSPSFSENDRVRILLNKSKIGSKGYTPNFSEDIYVIKKILTGRVVPAYKLAVADTDEPVTSLFYESELVRAQTQKPPETAPKKS